MISCGVSETIFLGHKRKVLDRKVERKVTSLGGAESLDVDVEILVETRRMLRGYCYVGSQKRERDINSSHEDSDSCIARRIFSCTEDPNIELVIVDFGVLHCRCDKEEKEIRRKDGLYIPSQSMRSLLHFSARTDI
jgi:hypothetical protein